MAVRFVEDGYEYLDGMAWATTAGSALVYDDGERTVMPWEDRPGYGQNDLIASDALRWMSMDRQRLAAVRPPVPSGPLFPPRFGYNHDPITIEDVFAQDGRWLPVRRSWMAPTVRTIQRSHDEDMWSGTERNVSMSASPMG
jgi:hypothetical protein